MISCEALKHEETRRKNIPTAEFPSILDNEEILFASLTHPE